MFKPMNPEQFVWDFPRCFSIFVLLKDEPFLTEIECLITLRRRRLHGDGTKGSFDSRFSSVGKQFEN